MPTKQLNMLKRDIVNIEIKNNTIDNIKNKTGNIESIHYIQFIKLLLNINKVTV